MEKPKHRRNEAAISMLAKKIREIRKDRNLTIEELAFRMDADYSQISRMERGKVNFTVSILFDVAIALEVPPSQLLENIKLRLDE
jgi:transcriptional regulator with XRE-family HTH domain